MKNLDEDPDLRPLLKQKGRPREPDKVGVLRECRRHGLTEHAVSETARRRYRCKRCTAEAVRRRHRRVRATLVAQAGGECAVCGYSRCQFNLHFHHVHPDEKSFNMSVAAGKSLAAYTEEAKKCVLVCANCHGEIETGLIPCPPLRES